MRELPLDVLKKVSGGANAVAVIGNRWDLPSITPDDLRNMGTTIQEYFFGPETPNVENIQILSSIQTLSDGDQRAQEESLVTGLEIQTPEKIAAKEGIEVKEGVDISKLSEKITSIFDEISDAFKKHAAGITPTITSSYEAANNKLTDSKHYQNEAIDLKINNLSQQQVKNIISEIKSLVGDDYDVVDKSAENHIHIEYDPN